MKLFNPTEDHLALRQMVRQFTEAEVDPQAEEYDRNEAFNVPLFRQLGELGLLGVTVDEAFGGSGFDATAAVIVHEELSAADPGLCLAYLAHSMLFANNLNVNGNDEQRRRYLPGSCDGTLIGGMAMSEPGAGTDVLGMKTTAQRDGDHYILNGAKMWITNGALNDQELGDIFLVYAHRRRSQRRQPLSGREGHPGFALVNACTVSSGCASSTAELVFDNCRVPAANLVGTEGGAMLSMMRNLEIERVTLAAMSVGLARRCVEIMNQYRERPKKLRAPLA